MACCFVHLLPVAALVCPHTRAAQESRSKAVANCTAAGDTQTTCRVANLVLNTFHT